MQSLWMVAAGLSFALMGVCVKYAAAHFSAAELVFYRALVQMAFAWAMLARLALPIRTAHLGMHVHRGVAGFVSLFMFYYALTRLPVATAMTLNYTSPVFLTILVAWFARKNGARFDFQREIARSPLARREIEPGSIFPTVLAGFAGCVLLLQPTLTPDQVWPAAIGLASGATSAISYWNVRALVRAHEPEARVVFYFGLFACLGALVWMAPQPWHPVTPANVVLLLGVGGFGGLGQLAMTRAYGKGSALVAAALSYSGIVFSSVLGILIWDDVLPLAAWLGIALIVAAGIIAAQRQVRTDRRAVPQITDD
ncbi:MAG: DMT family transporter [Betaproteobacteria bacterium]|nr:DMT family transporter [Betaproteobacteria bacterium]MCC7217628.1 DMT family transporter [Burkholderiales bacterium]